MTRNEIRISGFGGQGIILMGYITGKAATIFDKKYATLTQSYGPEARGGACSAQVIISQQKISYPVLVAPNLLITMSQAAYNAYRPGLKDDGLLIYDSGLVVLDEQDKINSISIPAKEIAEEVGRAIIANIVMLGFFTKNADIVSQQAMQKAIESSIPLPMIDLNMEAFQRGLEYKS